MNTSNEYNDTFIPDEDLRRERETSRKVKNTIFIIIIALAVLFILCLMTCNRAMAQHDQFKSLDTCYNELRGEDLMINALDKSSIWRVNWSNDVKFTKKWLTVTGPGDIMYGQIDDSLNLTIYDSLNFIKVLLKSMGWDSLKTHTGKQYIDTFPHGKFRPEKFAHHTDIRIYEDGKSDTLTKFAPYQEKSDTTIAYIRGWRSDYLDTTPQNVSIDTSYYKRVMEKKSLKSGRPYGGRKWTVALLSYDNGRTDTVHCRGVIVNGRENHNDTVRIPMPAYNKTWVQSRIIPDTFGIYNQYHMDTTRLNRQYDVKPKKKRKPKQS